MFIYFWNERLSEVFLTVFYLFYVGMAGQGPAIHKC